MSDTQRVIYAIIKFLRDQLTINELPPDGAEGVEVAVQCLESAYDITAKDASSLEVPKSLLEIFKDYYAGLVSVFNWSWNYNTDYLIVTVIYKFMVVSISINLNMHN